MEHFDKTKDAAASRTIAPAGTATAESSTDALLRTIEDRTGQVGVVGLGYVGLPLAMLFARAGFQLLGSMWIAAK